MISAWVFHLTQTLLMEILFLVYFYNVGLVHKKGLIKICLTEKLLRLLFFILYLLQAKVWHALSCRVMCIIHILHTYCNIHPNIYLTYSTISVIIIFFCIPTVRSRKHLFLLIREIKKDSKLHILFVAIIFMTQEPVNVGLI